jgi:hypothetical protein
MTGLHFDEAVGVGSKVVFFSGPKHAESGLAGGVMDEGKKLGGVARGYGDQEGRTVNEGAGEGGAALGGGIETPGEGGFEIGDAAEVEYLKGARPGGAGVSAADAKERHGDILRHGKGREQAGVVEEETEGFVAKLAGVFRSQPGGIVTEDADGAGIGGFE